MKKLLILSFCLTIILSGCAVLGPHVETTTTMFHSQGYMKRGTIFVVAGDPKDRGTLAFAHYKQLVDNKLVSVGYTIAKSADSADFIAFITYGINNGKTTIDTTPVYGQTGGGTTYSSGTVYGYGGSASYFGSSYSMPTYGVVGTTTNSSTLYTRAIALDIVDTKSLKSGHAKKYLKCVLKAQVHVHQ